jgi:7-cyano-7-deazaguanine synthase in queuosine biosynthesis
MIRHLLHISGGMDSTYVVWRWLKDNPDKRILLHHVKLRHEKEDRLEMEMKSVKNILNWLIKNGMTNWEYQESSFDYGSLPRITVKDIQIVSVFSSIILKTPQWKSIDTILLSWHLGEVNSEEIRRGWRVKTMLHSLEVDRDINIEFPIEFMSREDMARDMPEELLALSHSCRKPVKNQHCGKCKTCKELIEAKVFNVVGSKNGREVIL